MHVKVCLLTFFIFSCAGQMCGSRGPVGSSNILESALPFDLSIFKSLLQIEVSGCTFTLLPHFSHLMHSFFQNISSQYFHWELQVVHVLQIEIEKWKKWVFTGLFYFLMIDGCTSVIVLFLLLIWSHIFLFLCFRPQLSECSSQQIQGLSSLRSNLATLSIRHSTETMMVLSCCKPLLCIFLRVSHLLHWQVRCALTVSSPSWSRRQASCHSGILRGWSLNVPLQFSSPCGKTWQRWIWVTIASRPLTDPW